MFSTAILLTTFITLTVYIALICPSIRSPNIIELVLCKHSVKTKNRAHAVHNYRICRRAPLGCADVAAPITSKCLIKMAARHDPQFLPQAKRIQKTSCLDLQQCNRPAISSNVGILESAQFLFSVTLFVPIQILLTV